MRSQPVAAITTGGPAVPEPAEALPQELGDLLPADPGDFGLRPPGQRKLNWRIRLRRDKMLMLMTLPAIALVLVFNYLPMFGVVTAFEFYDPLVGVLHSQFIGLDNFRQLFADPLF